MERQESIERWLLGIPCEVSFWKNALARKADREWIAGNAGRDIDLHNFDVKEFMGEPGNSPDDLIIDLGCGLSYYAGSRLGGRPANIHFVDPLADFYNDILKEARAELPPIEFGMMEHISSYPHRREVVLVIIQNALDHSQDPIKGIMESLNLLKMGGGTVPQALPERGGEGGVPRFPPVEHRHRGRQDGGLEPGRAARPQRNPRRLHGDDHQPPRRPR